MCASICGSRGCRSIGYTDTPLGGGSNTAGPRRPRQAGAGELRLGAQVVCGTRARACWYRDISRAISSFVEPSA